MVLSGAATVETLRANLAAADVDWTEDLDARLEPLRENPDEYWERRSALPWN